MLFFPVLGNPKAYWRLPSEQLEKWAQTFPGLPIEAECLKALTWLDANPGKRKTSRGMPRFIVGWLLKAERDRTAGSTPRPAMRLPTWDSSWRDRCTHDPKCNSGSRHQTLVDLEEMKRAKA